MRELVRPYVLRALPEGWMCPESEFYVNPTGKFVIGGPDGDAGLTGRKIIVDTYGGAAPHGGGAFSGKDPTKVDRSAAYAARYLAKNVVAAGLAERCLIQLSYAIGVSKPLVAVRRHAGCSAQVDTARLSDVLRELMDLSPRGIREHLGLARPIYARTSAYGHFGRRARGGRRLLLGAHRSGGRAARCVLAGQHAADAVQRLIYGRRTGPSTAPGAPPPARRAAAEAAGEPAGRAARSIRPSLFAHRPGAVLAGDRLRRRRASGGPGGGPSRGRPDRLRAVRRRRRAPAVADCARAACATSVCVTDDARLLLRALPDGCLERIFVLFPDPWPKTRHHKRRIVNAATAAEFARLLQPGGELRLATDDMDYARAMLLALRARPELRWQARARRRTGAQRPADWPTTRYEDKAARGRPRRASTCASCAPASKPVKKP